MRTDRSVLSWLSLLVAAGLLTGCPGKLSNKEEFLAYAAAHEGTLADGGVASCGDVPARIFVQRCGDGGCHSNENPQEGLDLVSPDVATRVVGVASQGCTGTLAIPEDPANSLIYQKLATKPPCGAQMPLARQPLSSADVACVLAWIGEQGP